MERLEGNGKVTGLPNRSSSMVLQRVRLGVSAPRYSSLSPSLRSQWRKDRADLKVAFEDKDSGDLTKLDIGDSPPVDEMPFFDSYDQMAPEELRVRIYKDVVKHNLLEYMRSSVGNTHSLEDIELGKITTDNVDMFNSKTQIEKNIGFLWSALLRKTELLPGFLKCGAELHCSDMAGFSALHLAAFSGDIEACKYLISVGANVNLLHKRYTPLHVAAFGNSHEVTKLLLNNSARIEYSEDGDTALHSAVKANATECLQLLMHECVDINSIEPRGCSPLHLAADLGQIQCLKLLLSCEGVDPNVKTRDKQATPLHLAAENGYSECVTILLLKGANPDERNACGQTALHLAAWAQSVECVETLLGASGCNVNVTDNEHRTPLHSAVGQDTQAQEVVEVLIKRRADVNARDKYGYTPLHIAALNELAQCVETLFYYGADICAKTDAGITALSIVTRKIPATLGMLYKKLDYSILMHDPEVSNREVELKLDFRHILQHTTTSGEISYLKTFVDEGHKEILQHPLCEAFLYLKWQKIRKFYVARLVFCFLFIICLTAYAFSIAHVCYEDSMPITNVTNVTNSTCYNKISKIWEAYILTIPPLAIRMEWYILLFFTACEICRKLYSMPGYASIMQYVLQTENIFEWFVIVSVFSVYAEPIQSWQKNVAAISVLLGWTNLMFKIGQLPYFGSYVAMFMKVLKEFTKLFLAYCCLLIGFTISLCVILPSSDEFTYPHIGFIKVLVMMTGELNLINFLQVEKENTNVTFLIIFSLFILFVTIVLMNLLVGIAVHDIQGLQKTAGLAKLERQTRLISHIELALFSIASLQSKNMPRHLSRLLQRAALVSPSAYRVVLHVKPLNPQEKRLPRELLREAYKLAKETKRSKGKKQNMSSTIKSSECEVDSKYGSGKKIDVHTNIQNIACGVNAGEQTIKDLTKEISDLRNLISKLMVLVQKKESDC